MHEKILSCFRTLFLDETELKLNCPSESPSLFFCKTIWEDPNGESCTIYQDNNYCTEAGREMYWCNKDYMGHVTLFRVWLSRRCVHVVRTAFYAGFRTTKIFILSSHHTTKLLFIPDFRWEDFIQNKQQCCHSVSNTYRYLLDTQIRYKKDPPYLGNMLSGLSLTRSLPGTTQFIF